MLQITFPQFSQIKTRSQIMQNVINRDDRPIKKLDFASGVLVGLLTKVGINTYKVLCEKYNNECPNFIHFILCQSISIYIYIYKSRDLMRGSIKFCHVAHSMKIIEILLNHINQYIYIYIYKQRSRAREHKVLPCSTLYEEN